MYLDRRIAPPVADAIDFDYNLTPINRHNLANGVPLYWLKAGVQDVLEISWVFDAGVWYEHKKNLAHTVGALLKNGTSRYSAFRINEALEFYGASLKVNVGNDYTTLILHCLSKHVAHVLPVIYDIVTDAVFPAEELELYKRNTIQRLQISLLQCDFVANQQYDALLFGKEHPYGRYTEEENIENLERSDLLQHYKQFMQLQTCRIFAAGNVTDAVVGVIEQYFGQGNSNTAPAETVVSPEMRMTSTLKHYIVNDDKAVQTAIRIGRHFINRQHPDFAACIVLNTVLGGYFGSRLMSNIREDKGYTYGIYSSVIPYKHGSIFAVQTEVGREVALDAVNEIYKEMEQLCREPIAGEELLLVKNYLLGNILSDLDGPFQVIQRWRNLLLNGNDESYFYNSIRTYKNITPEELLRIANDYFSPENLVELLVS